MRIEQGLIDLLNSVQTTKPISQKTIEELISIDDKSLDSFYYTNTDRHDIEIVDDNYARCYFEWEHGYYMAIIDLKSKAFECVFIDLKYGKWCIINDINSNNNYKDTLDTKTLNTKSDKWKSSIYKSIDKKSIENEIQELITKGISTEDEANKLESLSKRLNELKGE